MNLLKLSFSHNVKVLKLKYFATKPDSFFSFVMGETNLGKYRFHNLMFVIFVAAGAESCFVSSNNHNLWPARCPEHELDVEL